ncbi:MAG: hypothetical protein ACYTEQ_06540 [Planctomycetota bacterium]|jgi:hypothetical protein
MTSTLKSGNVSGVPFAIADIITVCNDMPEIIKVNRTSENSARYFFGESNERIEIAEKINARLVQCYPEKYDA